MDKENAFLYQDLTPYDQVIFAKAIQISLQLMGKENCWCLKRNNHAIFQGFTTNKANRLFYKGRDARPLLLSIAGCNPPSSESVIVRKAICTSKYCLNPSHYYWGTRSDVAYENSQRRNNGINTSLITKLRQEKELGTSSLKLSKTYRIPYHIVRRICNYETYEEINNEDTSQEIWKNIDSTCQYLTTNYNNEGNFGAMGECLDCMEEIKKGRCEIDVTNFDFRWYWQVKRFWEQVDIGEKDECWVWQGATRKNNTESTAYFPSPFHSAKTQSAARVAFWLSRGYTGKYRIFNKKTCKPFCCNPTHLTIKELKNSEHPNEIERIRLSHGNIFEHYKKRQDSLQGK